MQQPMLLSSLSEFVTDTYRGHWFSLMVMDKPYGGGHELPFATGYAREFGNFS